jgi:hypothetical protein
MLPPIASIVEGHGEVEAAPILVRRIAALIDPAIGVQVLPPLRVSRYKLVKAGECERAVEYSARRTGGRGGILILVDAEDDCPAELGPQLLQRARQTRSDLPIAVVLAKCEFEAWFLAAAESLRGKRGLPHDLVPPPNPEAIQGAKEWLSARMTGGSRYRETLDQPALTNDFDFESARAADSFDKCLREVSALIATVRQRFGN